MRILLTVFFTCFFLLFSSCSSLKKSQSNVNLLTDFSPKFKDGDINVVIEISAGTLEKWEVNKHNGNLEWDKINNIPRVINYISYPANYGMIPRTLLPKEQGGDGDPLDVIVLGTAIKRGKIIKSKLIGVMYLIDKGEQDDKLIAIAENSPLYNVNNITELNEKYNGVTQILKLWFSNYKGFGKMKFKGFGTKKEAKKIVEYAIKQYQKQEK